MWVVPKSQKTTTTIDDAIDRLREKALWQARLNRLVKCIDGQSGREDGTDGLTVHPVPFSEATIYLLLYSPPFTERENEWKRKFQDVLH